jgi:undecaprenyl-diphosphatase
MQKLTLRRLGLERSLLIGLGGSAFGLWIFIVLADEIAEGEQFGIDEWLLTSVRSTSDPSAPIGPGWLHEAMRDITALGSTVVLLILTVGAVGFMFLNRDRRTGLWTLLAVLSGTILSFLLKDAFDRPRPDLILHMTKVYTSSFPSGHAMMSAVVYLTLGTILAAHQGSRSLKLYLLAFSVLLTLLVGASRVYLGVHWPTDVLAGWAIGASWAAACWSLDQWLQTHKKVEPARPGFEEKSGV